MVAGEAVQDHELAAVSGLELFGGVQEFDAADGAGRVDVHEDVVGQADGLDIALPLAEADVGDVRLELEVIAGLQKHVKKCRQGDLRETQRSAQVLLTLFFLAWPLQAKRWRLPCTLRL